MGYPLFAVTFFVANAAFLALYSLMIVVFMCKAKVSQIDVAEDEELDDESLKMISKWIVFVQFIIIIIYV